MRTNEYFASKPRYDILDGLRGVAAVMVVMFHLFETYVPQIGTQIINHGYLAVDFFFVLSGFVIGYAYDERWSNGKLSVWGFFKRRLVRLHPMVVAGTVLGTMLFYMQDAPQFPLVASTPWHVLLGMAVLGMLMIPVTRSMDIRGWQENYPINGPQWSLMFEYLANIVYALVLRRLPRYVVAILMCVAAIFTIDLGLGLNLLGDMPGVTTPEGKTMPLYTGNFIGGWGIEGWQLHVGLVRLTFPFLSGYMLSKFTRHIHVRAGFWVCAVLLALVMSIPQIGEQSQPLYNGIYETLIVLFLFPTIVSIGAGSTIRGKFSTGICKFLGDISYPLYITHYGLIYMQMQWVGSHPDWPVSTQIFMNICLLLLAIGIAYALLTLYDKPVRSWLTEHWLKRNRTAEAKGA